MAQYLLSVWMTGGVEPYATDDEMQQAFADVEKFNQEIQASGHWVFAGGLHPANRADFLTRLGRHPEAASAYESARTLTTNAAERAFLAERAAAARRRAG